MKKTIKNIRWSFIAALGMFLLNSCCRVSETEIEVLPQEEITSVELTLINLTTQERRTYVYNVGTVATPEIELTNGTNYSCSLDFKNGSESILEEILEEKNEHFVTYGLANTAIQLTRTDTQEGMNHDGVKLGLKSQWNVDQKIINPNNGAFMEIKLIHGAQSVSETPNSLGAYIGGETDVEVLFKIK